MNRNHICYFFILFFFSTIIGCSLRSSDDSEETSTAPVTLSGRVEFPESAGTLASIKAKVGAKIDFSKYRIYINGKIAQLNADGTFSGTVNEAEEYTIEVRFAGSPKAVLKATASKGEENQEIGVDVETTAYQLAFEAYKEQAGKSDKKFTDFQKLMDKADEAIKKIAESIETALQSLSNLESENFDLKEDENVKGNTEEAAKKAEEEEANQQTTSTTTSSTTTSTTSSTTSTTSSTGTAGPELPSGALAINDGAKYTTSVNVTLNLTGVTGAGTIYMSVDGGTFETLNQAKAHTVSAGDGEKSASIVLKDDNGESSAITDTIILDSTAPQASGTYPASSTAEVKVSTTVSVQFTEDIDPASVNPGDLILKDYIGNQISGSLSVSGDTITFTPNSYLIEKLYFATLSDNPTDLAGNPFNNGFTWKFWCTEAYQVKDIRSGFKTSHSYPQNFAAFQGMAFFKAQSANGNYELWKSDGTDAGTVLVKDINGGGSSNPDYLTAVNDRLFFTANDGINGTELWWTKGIGADTVMVKDINTDGNSNPNYLTNMNGTLYFRANDGSNGTELWKSDGTSAGTTMIKDINTDGNSGPAYLTNINGTLFFSATDGTNGVELWKSDGTSAGTVMVKDIYAGSDSSPQYLTNVNGTLFFSAADSLYARELWMSDGTSAGTVMVKDVNPSTNNSDPMYLTNVNGTLFFIANDGSNGVELWKSDGTDAGTVLVKDINTGGSSSPAYLTAVDDRLFFTATDGSNGVELWISDGSSAGTIMRLDIKGGSSSSTPKYLTNIDGNVYFQADGGNPGRELWKSDGTPGSGTVMVRNIKPDRAVLLPQPTFYPEHSDPAELTNVDGTLYFQADSGKGFELWSINN
ncbi:ELWxxDGT repeat protein [Candidatus Riflebacteria bacterium]